MRPSVLTIAVLFSIILSSCCHEIQCTNGINGQVSVSDLGFVSFTDPLDTIILRRFAINSNFQTPIDSLVLDTVRCRTYIVADTIHFYDLEQEDSFNITTGYDYEIFVPSTNTLAKIDNILEPQTQQKVCCCEDAPPTSCINPITSVNVNGQPQNYTYSIFINK